jgi:hypothetical protein
MSGNLIAAVWQDVVEDKTLRVYALLDGARSERIHPNVVLSLTDHVCLYEGNLPQELAEAAPYLVGLRKDQPFTRWLMREGRNRSWGLFVLSHSPLMELRRHFRAFLKVKNEAGRVLNFRFYDPRVLREFLPTCDGEQLKALFGPVHKFYLESGNGDSLLEFRLSDGLLVRRPVLVQDVQDAHDAQKAAT